MNEGGETSVLAASSEVLRRHESTKNLGSHGGNKESHLDPKHQQRVAQQLKQVALSSSTHEGMQVLAKKLTIGADRNLPARERIRENAHRLGMSRNTSNVLHAEELFDTKRPNEKQTSDTGKTQTNIFGAAEAQKNEDPKQAENTIGGSSHENTEETKKKEEPELTEAQKSAKKVLEQNEAMQTIYEQFSKLNEERVSRMMHRMAMMMKETDNPEEQEEMNILLIILQLITTLFQGTTEAAVNIGAEAAA